jgi:hypothetical protein
MHGPINVKSPNNTSKWQMGFNSAFKGLTTRGNALSTHKTGALVNYRAQPAWNLCLIEHYGSTSGPNTLHYNPTHTFELNQQVDKVTCHAIQGYGYFDDRP